MSASPANPPSGPNSITPTNNGPAMPRKRPAVSAFMQRKPKAQIQKRPPQPRQPGPSQNVNGVNINAATRPPFQAALQEPQTNGLPSRSPNPEDDPSKSNEFPLYTTKRAMMQGFRYHAIKFSTRPDSNGQMLEVNPYNPAQFTPPVRLHRRFPRDKQELADQSEAAMSGVDSKEREGMEITREERAREREANQALIAPSGGVDKNKMDRKKPQKKIQDVYYDDNNPAAKKRAQLRYEEGRPWHLEDFDAKNVWVGSYEEPLSENSAMFVVENNGFRVVPIEKWYKFSQTGRVKGMDSDQVEKHMSKKVALPRWMMKTQDDNEAHIKRGNQQKRGRQRRASDDEAPRKQQASRREYTADMDEIDFDMGGEFDDDDEGALFGDNEEDAKEAQDKVWKEQREANIFELKDEDKDWDAEEERTKLEERAERKKARKLKKQLVKKERQFVYDSDSDHPYSESSDSEDSGEEAQKEEERKRQEAKKTASNNGDKSGASTKGTNTPSGRAEKRDQSRLGPSLKRPGSPNLTEASGNESSRKKVKSSFNGTSSRAMSPSGVPASARSLSPDSAAGRKPSRTSTGGSGSGSGSDTDTSRSGRRKLKLKHSPPASVRASPTGSRAGSPQRPATPPAQPFPTADEIRAAIPPEGINIREIVTRFKARLPEAEANKRFILLVKSVARHDKTSNMLFPKSAAQAGAASPSAAAS